MSEKATDPEVYVLWSNEHRAWWASPAGYTPSLKLARCFTRTTALQTAMRAIPGTAERMGMLPELPMRLADLQVVTARYREKFPDLGPKPWE